MLSKKRLQKGVGRLAKRPLKRSAIWTVRKYLKSNPGLLQNIRQNQTKVSNLFRLSNGHRTSGPAENFAVEKENSGGWFRVLRRVNFHRFYHVKNRAENGEEKSGIMAGEIGYEKGKDAGC